MTSTQPTHPPTQTAELRAAATLTSEQFRSVMGLFASGVTIITTRHEGERCGSTASAVSSLSLEPPMLLICMNMSSTTGRAVAETERFAVNILGEDHSDIAVRFSSRNVDKFAGLRTTVGVAGAPLLDDAIATLECEVSQTVTGGTHYVFLSRVVRARGRLAPPLAYFRGQFGRLELAEDQAATTAIRERVLHREIPIGEPLDLTKLGAEVGAPRGSVYQALARLAAEGWVERDRDGTFTVAPVTRASLVSSARARVAILAGAALAAAPYAGERDISRLREVMSDLQPPGAPGMDPHEWFARRRAMVEQVMAMTDTGSVLLDAFNRADVPAQIHEHLFAKPAGDRAELGLIHDGYAAILESSIAGDRENLLDAVSDLLATYDRLYSSVAEKRSI